MQRHEPDDRYLYDAPVGEQMRYTLSVLVNKEDKLFVARGVEIELASQGATVDEAVRNLREAFELWLKHADAQERKQLTATPPFLTHVAAEA